MEILTATLVTDGTSDRTLIPIVQFLLDEWSPIPHRILFAQGLHNGPLASRLPLALKLYPCDLLFIHRDSETLPFQNRHLEIEQATKDLGNETPHVCLIPVRMTEAWLLLDASAIRAAAGNPNGDVDLHLPNRKLVEKVADPKAKLFEALTTASEKSGRRKRQFKPEIARHRIAELMNCAELRIAPSFARAESEVRKFFSTYQ